MLSVYPIALPLGRPSFVLLLHQNLDGGGSHHATTVPIPGTVRDEPLNLHKSSQPAARSSTTTCHCATKGRVTASGANPALKATKMAGQSSPPAPLRRI